MGTGLGQQLVEPRGGRGFVGSGFLVPCCLLPVACCLVEGGFLGRGFGRAVLRGGIGFVLVLGQHLRKSGQLQELRQNLVGVGLLVGSGFLGRAANGRPYGFGGGGGLVRGGFRVPCCLLPVACCLDRGGLRQAESFQGCGQGGDAGVGQGQAKLLRGDLPAAQAAGAVPGHGKGGEALFAGAVAEIEAAQLGHELVPGDLLRGQAEEQGGPGADGVEDGLAEAAFPQQGQGPGDDGPGPGDPVGLVQGEDHVQQGIGGQLVQQGDLGRGVHPLRVQDADPETVREARFRKIRQGGQQGPSPRIGDADSQLFQRSHGKASFIKIR